tara:strand:+ start:189 stop:377 length:189 start_codon:yes stop_codon:yes gene_type:complete
LADLLFDLKLKANLKSPLCMFWNMYKLRGMPVGAVLALHPFQDFHLPPISRGIDLEVNPFLG